MADFLRFLPLSARPRQDEGDVSSDRRREIDALLESLSAVTGAKEMWAAFATDAGLAGPWRASDGTITGFRAAVLTQRRSIRVLSKALAAALRIAADLGTDLEVDPMTAGAVALYAHGAGPFERRAVVAGHTVRATDAEWAFGNGPVLEGTAVQIAGFLLGVTDDPPRPPDPASEPPELTSSPE
ncbi:MAG: hypothetical protein DSY74_02220 [Actinobacteria bacterium]|uniref:hypothetical protein n=1 Tax=unclassified Microbacterium TaxID=2609290 RepID=UPI00100138A8|nr:hypothetical protein [Microbacterium sp. UBA837]RUA27287.1 MAG: hypothetical protein DSY74_02220 [Actinomycetota bacterium]